MSSGHLAKSVVTLVYVPRAAPIKNFANTVSDGQHCVRIIDESLMWDDRGADVSRLSCACNYICVYYCICVCIRTYIHTLCISLFSIHVYVSTYTCLSVCLFLMHVHMQV